MAFTISARRPGTPAYIATPQRTTPTPPSHRNYERVQNSIGVFRRRNKARKDRFASDTDIVIDPEASVKETAFRSSQGLGKDEDIIGIGNTFFGPSERAPVGEITVFH